ncbi:uncharacterized protein TM35_000123160 [Trypanosoma theileri]|uniref:Uncharacterized protein n=1 Tax=Trypanosoma theileri TaxID=67003 RepID=A0A1X0NY51_9TRYP|nr:uncharacterized protein TM35_000123160 [Trypanosoma theileri]ORC89541.1 hypothetical protein TM35_000123160 [Trypanosoma theileri]
MRNGGHTNDPVVDECVNGGDDSSTASAYPWDGLCNRILAAYKEGEDISVLQLFEELQMMPELDVLIHTKQSATATELSEEKLNLMKDYSNNSDSAALEKVEFCWGRALLAAKRVAHDDDEHIVSIVENFEQRFERPSDYLRCLAITADGALEVLQIHQLVEGRVSAEAVTAALHKFPLRDAAETRDLLEFMRVNGVHLTRSIAEQLEKHFVKRMKTEDPEDVFCEMREAGVKPMSTRPYNFLFMKKTPFKQRDLLGYYEDMLDRGITPENSTFRILSKQTQHDGFANQHFSALAWGNTAPQQQRRRDEAERGGTQVFFATRLEELARTSPDTSLDTALQVLRRMDVEGTQLTNGSPILGSLLLYFCHPTQPEDTERVLQLAQDRGCHPNSATVQKLLRDTSTTRFEQAEIVLQKVVEAGETLQVDCVDLLRYFVMNNKRSKAVRVFRAFVVHRYRHSNEQIPFAIASMAMKLGPFNWALGVLSILLASVDKPLGRGVQSRMRSAAHDVRSRDIIEVFNRCDWKRERLLLADELQERPFNGSSNTTSTENNNNSSNNNNNNINNVNGGDSAYTGSKSHNRLDGGPTWISAMHIALKEMNVDPKVMEAYKAILTDAIEKARRHQGHSGEHGSGSGGGGGVSLNSGHSRGK